MDELIAALLRALEKAQITAVKAFPEGIMPKLTGPVTAAQTGRTHISECSPTTRVRRGRCTEGVWRRRR